VARAQSIVCCTSDELTNLDIALDARDLKPDIKVVLRMFDRAFAAKVAKGFNIKTALSVSALAAPAFAAAATRVNIDHSFRVRDQALNVRTVTARAGGQLANRSVRDLQHALNISIVMRNDVLHPAEDDVIMTHDTITCVGALDAIDRLNAAA
jgi:Trk K+ transport system NAD-binding subunit